MIMKLFFVFSVLVFFACCSSQDKSMLIMDHKPHPCYPSSKPCTRWWWFASMIQMDDVKAQLDWFKANHFGGVEIAWIYPPGRKPETPRIKWLGEEWTHVVAQTKKYADSIGLACDFTFGSIWPFGGTFVPDQDRGKVFGNPDFKQKHRLSWDHPEIGNVIDHMSKAAFDRYALVMGGALKEALTVSPSALFCDSWEVETRKIWTDGFGETFKKRFGYEIEPFMEKIYSKEHTAELYDYMTLVSDYVINEFYKPFTKTCHELNAYSRAQCGGSPTDLITAFASVDIPETEAMLYEPPFSRIPASAAAYASQPIVSSETFTCLYGFPGDHLNEELVLDLKLVADALFAHGVNHIFWHGAPYNTMKDHSNRFYATVHVGQEGKLARDLPQFNRYMEKVSSCMRSGCVYSDVAVYLPLEDGWIAGEYPEERRMPWSWGAYELRYLKLPEELKGRHPLWINHHFLKKAGLERSRLICGDASFSSLYIDVEYLDSKALDTILELAAKGFPICLKRTPLEPGRNKSGDYKNRLEKLMGLKNVSASFEDLALLPALLEGEDLPDYWCRVHANKSYIFFSHPNARNLTLPMKYGQYKSAGSITKKVILNLYGNRREIELPFEPCQSLLLEADDQGGIRFIDVDYSPHQ